MIKDTPHPFGFIHIQSQPDKDVCLVKVRGVTVCQLHVKNYVAEKDYATREHKLIITVPGMSDSIISYDP